MQGAPCIGDTAIERRKSVLRLKSAVRHPTAVPRYLLSPHSTTLASGLGSPLHFGSTRLARFRDRERPHSVFSSGHRGV